MRDSMSIVQEMLEEQQRKFDAMPPLRSFEDEVADDVRAYLEEHPKCRGWRELYENVDHHYKSQVSLASTMIQKYNIRLKEYRELHKEASADQEVGRHREVVAKLGEMEAKMEAKLNALDFKMDQLTELVKGMTR